MSASEGRTDFPFKVTLGAIDCKLLLVEDAEAAAKIRARARTRHSEQVRYKPARAVEG